MANKKTPSIVVLMILTLITSIFWVSFSIYRGFIDETDPIVSEEISAEITPLLDSETIGLIKNKTYP